MTVIFDFDGTLADVIPVFKEIYHELSPRYGLRDVSDTDYRQLRKKTAWEVVRWTGLKPWNFPGLLKHGRKLFAESKDQVKLYDGIPELIKTLHKNGYKLYILSSNSESTIRSILNRYSLDDEVVVMKRPWFFGKAGSIKQLVMRKKYDKQTTWMVGDEVRDVRAGNKAGVQTISVTWGLQDGEILKKQNPNHLASKVSELSKILTSQNN